ncbi:Uncharacterised protein [Salmonella enterica subsp. enterica serovar Bovismorbificans]|nr:Uncharacterised protein [Salmonella enterica subsp. enterica serovar Bovismorbificans]
MHQNAISYFRSVQEFFRLRQNGQTVVYRMGGGDTGIAFPEAADHTAASDNRIHHVAKCLGQPTLLFIR